VLALLVALIAIGSFLFHTFATVWAGWLDVVFILAFIYAFLAAFLARVAAGAGPRSSWASRSTGSSRRR
jgi:hypothetical protein